MRGSAAARLTRWILRDAVGNNAMLLSAAHAVHLRAALAHPRRSRGRPTEIFGRKKHLFCPNFLANNYMTFGQIFIRQQYKNFLVENENLSSRFPLSESNHFRDASDIKVLNDRNRRRTSNTAGEGRTEEAVREGWRPSLQCRFWIEWRHNSCHVTDG